MRPDPHQTPPPSDADRIIYIGDVRRKRAARRKASNRYYLATLALLAIAAWAVWLIVLFNLEPARLLTYLAFFAPLAVALAATSAALLFGFELRSGRYPSLVTCGRRGVLIAAIVVINLTFQAARHWTLPVLAITAASAVAAEVASERRAG